MRYIKENLKEFEICGILRWHELGYTGKRIKIAEIEGADTTLNIFDGKLHDPLSVGVGEGINGHGQKVFDVDHQIAPDAELYILDGSGSYSSSYAKGKFIEESIPFAESEHIDFVGGSMGGVNNDILSNRILEAQKKGIIFTCSAGNMGTKGTNGYTQSNVFISWTAVGVNSKDQIFLKDYSSRGKGLDFAAFSGLYVYNAKDITLKTTMQMEGTSFSHPMGRAMMALVQQFFYEKSGKKLNQTQMYEFVKDNTRDFGVKGYDEEFGYGLFILPEPSTIDIKKYIGEYQEEENMKFNDDALIAVWAKESVDVISDLGIMKGDEKGNFNPKSGLTREEYSATLYRLLKYLGKV
jgi:hypothetical protein